MTEQAVEALKDDPELKELRGLEDVKWSIRHLKWYDAEHLMPWDLGWKMLGCASVILCCWVDPIWRPPNFHDWIPLNSCFFILYLILSDTCQMEESMMLALSKLGFSNSGGSNLSNLVQYPILHGWHCWHLAPFLALPGLLRRCEEERPVGHEEVRERWEDDDMDMTWWQASRNGMNICGSMWRNPFF
jgi:hypothetical protein